MLIPPKKKTKEFLFLVFHLKKLYHWCSNQQVKLEIINWFFDNLLRTQFIILIFDHPGVVPAPKKAPKQKNPT
jgi:hypothetical protein